MRNLSLNVRNFRAVKEANIQIKGITVVAGVNSTGKSTLSRLLYHVVKQALEFEEDRKRELGGYFERLLFSLTRLARDLGIDIEDRVKYFSLQRRSYIGSYDIDELNKTIDELIDEFEKGLLNRSKTKNLSVAELKRVYSVLNIEEPLEREKSDDVPFDFPSLFNELRNKLDQVRNSTKEKINERSLSIFTKDLNNILRLQGFNIDFSEDDIPLFDRERNRVNNIYTIENVFYIDTPFALQIAESSYRGIVDIDTEHWSHLKNSITNAETLQMAGEPQSVYTYIADVIEGDALIDNSSTFGERLIFKRSTDGLTIDLSDSATGIKSFAILQMLLSHGLLNDKTLLILDEPEAHLHPQWIVEYARVLVLLNRHLGVRFLLASHNPDMVSALRYISEQEETLDDLNFYLSEETEETQQYNFRDLGVDIEPIFDSFNVAFDKISRYGI